jgi:hypothetical protein
VTSTAKKRLKEKLSFDRTAASRSCCCSTGCSNLSCSKAKCSVGSSRTKEQCCSDQTAAALSSSCSTDWLNSASLPLSCWRTDLQSVRCCSCWCSVLPWSSWKTTMTASGYSLKAADLTAAEPTLDSATCSAGQPVFAIDPEWCYSMCWASLLNFEQARNQRSSPVPFLICTGSSSFDYSL